jgi:hypothetical protein
MAQLDNGAAGVQLTACRPTVRNPVDERLCLLATVDAHRDGESCILSGHDRRASGFFGLARDGDFAWCRSLGLRPEGSMSAGSLPSGTFSDMCLLLDNNVNAHERAIHHRHR